MAPKWLQMPSVMELVGHGARKCGKKNAGVENGGVRGATGAGYGIPSRRARREKRSAAGWVCLSLARRYNTLDLAGKVSVPRGCGPFGNPVEERRREAGATGRLLPVRDCDGGDSGRHCLPGDRVLWRGYRRYVRGTGQRGHVTFCESVTTHYDTFCLPAESSKVPWAKGFASGL